MAGLKPLFPPDFAERLRAWFRVHARDLPWRRTRDPYAIMVSEFMLQQTQVATVIPFYERWLRRFPTVQSLAEASEQEILALWQGLGYYSRARNLHRAAKLLVGEFPGSLAELRNIPGMGDYTAGAILTFAHDLRVPIVEANIARVLARLCEITIPIDTTEGRKKIWSLAAQALPETGAGEFNAALMELGALICTPRPHCDACPVRIHCQARHPERLPAKSPKAVTTQKVERALFFQRGHEIAFVQRIKNPWLGLWVLPELIRPPDVLEMPLVTHRYSITRYRVTLEIYTSQNDDVPWATEWLGPEEWAALPMPAPHRRVLEALTQIA